MPPDADRKQTKPDERSCIDVVYVGGTGRSGSTIIEHYLADALGAVVVGETVYLWSRGIENDQLCGCGESFSRCPFWTGVTEQGQILERHADALGELWRLQSHRVKAIPRILGRGRRDRTLDAAAEAYESLFRAVAVVGGRPTVIESSKHPAFWLFFRLVPGVRLHTLYVVRDSRAVAFSWRRKVARPELSLQRTEHMILMPYWKTALQWLAVNLLYLVIRGRAHNGHFVTLKYEDFATNPDASIERVRKRLGLDGNDELGRPPGTDGAMLHSVSGNPVRFDPVRLLRVSLDDEWRRSMPRHFRALVTLLTFPLLVGHRYVWRRRRGSAAG